jgi:hypothetical protein
MNSSFSRARIDTARCCPVVQLNGSFGSLQQPLRRLGLCHARRWIDSDWIGIGCAGSVYDH